MVAFALDFLTASYLLLNMTKYDLFQFTTAHYGHPKNMILTRPIPNIGDGWETARRMDRPDVITGQKNQN